MMNQNWQYRNIANNKRCIRYCMQMDVRYPGIFIFSKNVIKFAAQRFLSHLVCINRHSLVLKKIKSFDVVKAGNMVFMRMSENNGIQFFYFFTQHLGAKIGSSINN